MKTNNIYNLAALNGFGRFLKRSPEAMEYMAKLRSKRKTQLVKGSPEAKAYMAKLRAMRKSKKITGNGIIPGVEIPDPVTGLVKNSLGYWKNYFTGWAGASKARKAEIARLKAMLAARGGKYEDLKRLKTLWTAKGGKFEMQDLRDGFMGPIGWIRMIIRKKQQRELERLRKELNLDENGNPLPQ